MRQALGRFDRLQTQVENLEARVRSYEVGGPAPATWTDEATATDPAIEEDLRLLMERISRRNNPDQAEAGA